MIEKNKMINSNRNKFTEYKIKVKRICFLLVPLYLLLSYYILVITLFNVLNTKNKTISIQNSTLPVNKTWNITYNYSEYINNSNY